MTRTRRPRPLRPGRARPTAGGVVGIALLTGVGVAGCAGNGPVAGAADARDAWAERGPSSYSFTLAASCGERNLLGRFAVTVADGAVVLVEPLDEAAELAPPSARDEVPTIDELLDRIVAAPAEQVREAEFDDDGVPTRVFFDHDPRAMDDEECYDVADVRGGL